MRSFVAILILLLCVFEVAHSAPSPARKAVAPKKIAVPKKVAAPKKVAPPPPKKVAPLPKKVAPPPKKVTPPPPKKAAPLPPPPKKVTAAAPKKVTPPPKKVSPPPKKVTAAPPKKVSAAPKKAATTAKKTSAAPKKAATTAKKTTTSKKTSTAPAPAKATANNSTLSCKLPAGKTAKATKTKTAAKKVRELVDAISSIFRRDTEEFVGYHGTNGANAQAYMAAGNAGKGIPILSNFNGADAELGSGIYISDDIDVAQTFATGSAGSRNAKGQTANGQNVPFICVVKAESSSTWRNSVSKVWIPVAQIATLVGGVNNPEKLKQQEETIKCAGHSTATTVRFSVLDVAQPNNPRNGNQMMVPPAEFSKLTIKNCAPVTSQVGNLPKDFGTPTFPSFSYLSQRGPWNIAGNE